MALAEKLTIGLLEEDNPVKAFFRFKPLYSMTGDGFEKVDDTEAMFPEDGFIRIVPDKNEASRFRTRMRTIGPVCCLDLRRYHTDTEKIRENKNYRRGGFEKNSHIVYSDVITELPLAAAALVTETEDAEALRSEHPSRMRFFAGHDGVYTGPWKWIQDGENIYRPARSTEFEQSEGALPEGIQLEIRSGEETYHLLIAAEGNMLLKLAGAPVKQEEPDVTASEAEPVRETEIAEEKKPDEIPAPAPVNDIVTVPAAQKPQEPYQRRRNDPRTGLNPRRGTSILELVDEQWRTSRLEKLGQPVPPEATTNPMFTPVDNVRAALKTAWNMPEARESVADAVLSVDGLSDVLKERFGTASEPLTAAENAQLNEYEALRLKAVSELDKLTRAAGEKRAELLEDVKRENAAEIKRLEKQSEAVKNRIEKLRAEEKAAEEAAARAGKALDELKGEKLLDKLADDAVRERAAGMLHALGDTADHPQVPQLYTPASGELISDLRILFENNGLSLTHDEAVNLLAGAVLFSINIYSGPAGSGKSLAASLMTQALGLGHDRSALVLPSRGPLFETETFKTINAGDTLTPLALRVEDGNVTPGDPTRGFAAVCADAGINANLRMFLTVQDQPAGFPLTANVLDKAFFVRLSAPAEDTEWGPVQYKPLKAHAPVAMETLRELFSPEGELPMQLVDRMKRLRKGLSEYGVLLSARALNDTCRYILTASRYMTCPPLNVFDYAVAQRILPCVLATAPAKALQALPQLLIDLPLCTALLTQPLALPGI